jgi:hypothetical protein
MPLFICRWQSGDFSAVSASSREEAMELLDEVGNADVAEVFTAKMFMVHFQLKKQVDSVEEPVPVDLKGSVKRLTIRSASASILSTARRQ